MDEIQADEAEAAILRLAGDRGPGKSICPSEAARLLDEVEWRSRLGEVRAAAARLSRAGRIDILRKGRPIEPGEMRGVVRLRVR